jgi:hypothetical protein
VTRTEGCNPGPRRHQCADVGRYVGGILCGGRSCCEQLSGFPLENRRARTPRLYQARNPSAYEASEREASDDGDLKLNNSTGQVKPASRDISVTAKNQADGNTPELSA